MQGWRMARTACPLDCPDTCSLEVAVEDGRITRIDAAPGNPFTAGFICAKVRRHDRRVHAPERVHTPLIRTGPKGAAEFRETSWDEALDLVADRVRRALDVDGPEAVVPYLYNSSAGVLARGGLSVDLWERLGAVDVEATICASTADAAWAQVYGTMPSADPFDLDHGRMILVWGANPGISNTHLLPLLDRARARGATLAVVDPRRTATVRRADLHLAPLPGTDVVVALAMAHHLERAGLLDRAVLDAHATGVEAYLAAAAEWSPERAAPVAGVAAGAIVELAEAYATTRPALLRVGWGLERNRNGGSGLLAVLALPLLAGQVGVPGSGVVASLDSPVRRPRAGLRQPDGTPAALPERTVLNMNRIGAALVDGDGGARPTVLFVQGANPAVTAPDQLAVLAGLAREDLFCVVHDQVLTDTACFADVVLPAPTHFEVTDLAPSYGTHTLQRVEPVIARVGESRTNDEVAAALAVRLGLPAEPFDPDPERLLPAAVASGEPPTSEDPVRITAEPGTRVAFRDVFPDHEGGRARLHDPASELPLPRYRPPADDRWSLVLVSPASSRTVNSLFGELDASPAVLALHPDDAIGRGILDGQRVRVFDDRVSIEVPCRLDTDLRPGVCSLPKGLWRRRVEAGLTANAFAPATLSDLGGGACFNDARVEVAPA